METMQSWFGLAGDHRDFSIETEADSRLFFARNQLDKDLHRRLRRAFRTQNPPKMVLYGEWGSGKTHTMRHMEYVMELQDSYNALIVFVELPDITRRSSFQVAHGALLDAFGIDRAKNWLLHFQTKHPNDARDQIQEFTQSGDIAIAFANLLGFGDASRIAWDWLRGVKLSAGDARMASLPPILDQSNHFVHVLQMLGRLAREVEDKMLVFMLDEATKLDNVSDDDAIAHWINALKILADDNTKEVGVIVSGSWVDTNDMAEPLNNAQVSGRFGRDNYIRLSNLDEEETHTFISDLVHEWIDDAARDDLVARFGSQADGEAVSAETFPFTDEGLVLAARHAAYRDGAGYTTPRDIQKTVDDLLNRAIDDERRILSSSYVNGVVNA